MSISTYTLFSDAAVETALDVVGGEMMGTQDTELLKQIFVAAGNQTSNGGAYLPKAGGTMTGDITMTDGTKIVTGSGAGTQFGTGGTTKLAFFGATPIVQPAVLGSRADPEGALASLLFELARLGIISDQTTP